MHCLRVLSNTYKASRCQRVYGIAVKSTLDPCSCLLGKRRKRQWMNCTDQEALEPGDSSAEVCSRRRFEEGRQGIQYHPIDFGRQGWRENEGKISGNR